MEQGRQGRLSGLADIVKTMCAVFFAVLAFFLVRSLHAGGIEGRVGEILNPESSPSEWRYAPLANVDILVIWNGSPLDNPVHGHSVCVRAAYARTDANGKFSLAGWWSMPQWPLMTDVRPRLTSAAAGFRFGRWQNSADVPAPTSFTLKLIRDTDEPVTDTRIEEIDPLALYSCPRPRQPEPVS